MLTDYHSHTPRCRHAQGEMWQYVERAIELGLGEFGFSDHSPWMIQDRGEQAAMDYEELPLYVADVQALQARYRREGSEPFHVRLGMEMDYVPSRMGLAREAIASWPWDYLIGSVHHLGFWCLPKPSTAELYDRHRAEDVCEQYYDLVGRMVDERFCDIIGHLDLPGKFGHQPEGGMLRYIEPLIARMRVNDIVVELNTSGVDAPCGQVQPGWEVVEALAAGGVGLMINSDSHHPSHVGRHFGPTLERLRGLGVQSLVRFEGRRPESYPIGNAPVGRCG